MFRKLLFRLKMLMTKKYSMYFVSGGEALPSPLNEEDEKIAIEGLKNGDKKCKNKLVEHNLRLVVYIAKKFENTKIELDELISVGTLGLIKAVNSFKPEKEIKLATFASRCIENEILMYLRKHNRQKNEVSLDEPINVDSEGNVLMLQDVIGSDRDLLYENLEHEIDIEMLHKAFLKLNTKEQEIMKLRFGIYNTESKTQKEIADMFGISQSYISRLEKKIMHKLKKEMENMNRI